MRGSILLGLMALCLSSNAMVGLAQDAGPPASDAPAVEDSQPAEESTREKASDRVQDAVEGTQQKVSDLAAQVDKNSKANEAKSGILSPIYLLAEKMNFSSFHWLAFMFMITGVVSFALQLVLGKLIALTKFGFSLTEILSDALGLIISLVGLVLTTQAATENSSFTESSFAVISATGLGVVLGFLFYLWGQRQELQAIDARTAVSGKSKVTK
jgi:ABC-type multidrug transport system fused ATPase/permease subunit